MPPFPVPPIIPVDNPMKITVQFLDADNNLFDPASNIKVKVVDPDGTESIFTYPSTLNKDSAGIYSVIIEASKPGDWVGKGSGALPDGKVVTTPDVSQYVSPSQLV